jgi:hypothetical protein
MNTKVDSHGTEVKRVGRSGQISLGKRYAGKMLRLERFKDGRIVLTAVAMVPESQLWTLAEPDRSKIERGLDWAAKTAPAETDINDLLKRRARKVPRPRARRP